MNNSCVFIIYDLYNQRTSGRKSMDNSTTPLGINKSVQFLHESVKNIDVDVERRIPFV